MCVQHKQQLWLIIFMTYYSTSTLISCDVNPDRGVFTTILWHCELCTLLNTPLYKVYSTWETLVFKCYNITVGTYLDCYKNKSQFNNFDHSNYKINFMHAWREERDNHACIQVVSVFKPSRQYFPNWNCMLPVVLWCKFLMITYAGWSVTKFMNQSRVTKF